MGQEGMDSGSRGVDHGLSWTTLDRRGFLGYRAWDFTRRSLGHRYGWHFLIRVVLRHPLRTLTGYLAFRRLANPMRAESGAMCLFAGPSSDFLRQAASDKPGRFLLALGFCQKKMATTLNPVECPAGRFNHDCLFVEGKPTGANAACDVCDVRLLAEHALGAGASLYLMTAAQEITRDVLAPALEQGRFGQTLMLLCPMSVQAVLAPMSVCRLPGFILGYHAGHCASYAEWLRADRGDKPKQTSLLPAHLTRAIQILDTLALERRGLGQNTPSGWSREGFVYTPRICDQDKGSNERSISGTL